MSPRVATNHVRLEERELFPAIEAALDEPELSRLAADVAAAEQPGHPA
jgi:hypothetical protein